MMKRTSSLVLILKDLVDLYRIIQLHFCGISGWDIDLDYCDVEWFALEMPEIILLVFEVAPK